MSTKPKTWGWLLLCTTSATLLCCALPIMLVSLGMGTIVASMVGAAPWLISLSVHKVWVFVFSGVLLMGAAWAIYRPGRSCPADPQLAAACAAADKWNSRFFWLSYGLWCSGFFAAFVLVLI